MAKVTYRGVPYNTDTLQKEYIYVKQKLVYRGTEFIANVKKEVSK